jgi:hypothetical protein
VGWPEETLIEFVRFQLLAHRDGRPPKSGHIKSCWMFESEENFEQTATVGFGTLVFDSQRWNDTDTERSTQLIEATISAYVPDFGLKVVAVDRHRSIVTLASNDL